MTNIINDNGTDRPMTAAEHAAYESAISDMAANQEQRELEIIQKREARESAIAKLSALGLTEAEISALLGQ